MVSNLASANIQENMEGEEKKTQGIEDLSPEVLIIYGNFGDSSSSERTSPVTEEVRIRPNKRVPSENPCFMLFRESITLGKLFYGNYFLESEDIGDLGESNLKPQKIIQRFLNS